MGLSYNWTAMKNLVDGLYPNGSTNQPIGLVWAWQSLVGGGPLTVPAKDANYTYKEVIILLSDGLNTQNRWNGNGSDQSTSVDNRMMGERRGRHLQEHQGHRDHDLRHPGEHRRRSGVTVHEELRERTESS